MAQDLMIYHLFPHLIKTLTVRMDKLVFISFPFAIQQLFQSLRSFNSSKKNPYKYITFQTFIILY